MNVPLLSVCLVAYNQEAYIRKVLVGIMMQCTNFTFEVVIGEDHSSDRTREICQEHADLYPDVVRLLPQEKKNLGLNHNFLRTFRACRGKYIAYLEGDDYFITIDKLQKQVDILEKNNDIVLVHTNCKVWNVKNNSIRDHLIQFDGVCIREQQYGLKSIEAEFRGHFRPIKTSTCVYRRAVMQQILDDDENAYSNKQFPTQDFQLFLDMSFRGKFAFIDEDTTVIGLGDTISVNSNPKKDFEFKRGFYLIGLYYIDKYHLSHATSQIWLQKELHWFLNFALLHADCPNNVDELIKLAKEKRYRIPVTQQFLLLMIHHPLLKSILFPLYKRYYFKRK